MPPLIILLIALACQSQAYIYNTSLEREPELICTDSDITFTFYRSVPSQTYNLTIFNPITSTLVDCSATVITRTDTTDTLKMDTNICNEALTYTQTEDTITRSLQVKVEETFPVDQVIRRSHINLQYNLDCKSKRNFNVTVEDGYCVITDILTIATGSVGKFILNGNCTKLKALNVDLAMNKTWTDAYLNSSSPEFQALEAIVVQNIKHLFENNPAILDIRVRRFIKGSVHADMALLHDPNVDLNATQETVHADMAILHDSDIDLNATQVISHIDGGIQNDQLQELNPLKEPNGRGEQPVSMTLYYEESHETSITKIDVVKYVDFLKTLSMDFYETSAFQLKSPSPKLVQLDDPIYVEVSNTLPDNNHLRMVVKNCFATNTPKVEDATFNYGFMFDGCGLDNTYRTLRGNLNYFRFQINTFVFIAVQKQVYLHCSLWICMKDSLASECIAACDAAERKRKRRAVDNYKIGQDGNSVGGYATSGALVFRQSGQCEKLNCPVNSWCHDIRTSKNAFCRCQYGLVENYLSKNCTDRGLITLDNFRLVSTVIWSDRYKNPSSSEFLRFSHKFEVDMMNFYVHENRLTNVMGMKVIGARNVAGRIYLQIHLLHSSNTTKETIIRQFTNVHKSLADEVEHRVKIHRDSAPTLVHPPQQSQSRNGPLYTVTLISVLLPCVLVILLLVIIAYVVVKRKSARPTNDPIKEVGY